MKKTNRIKEIRESQGIKQNELARIVGVSQPYLHDLENDRRGGSPLTISRIAEALGVSMAELTGKKVV